MPRFAARTMHLNSNIVREFLWLVDLGHYLRKETTMAGSSSGAALGASGLRGIGGKDCNPPGSCTSCVRASALGAELTDEQLRTLCDIMEVKMLSKGETLISEGEYDDHLYAIAAGEMEVFLRSEGGREVSVQRLRQGSLTGELAFLEGLKRTATVRAKEDVCAVFLHGDQLEGLLSVDPLLVYRVMRAVVRSAHRKVGNLNTAYTDLTRYVLG